MNNTSDRKEDMTPAQFMSLKTTLRIQNKSDQDINNNLTFDTTKDSDTDAMYTVVSYKSASSGRPWTDLRGMIVKDFNKVVAKTTGYTESVLIDSFVSEGSDKNYFQDETGDYLRVQRPNAEPVFMNLRKGQLRVNLEGALLRVWKQDGKIYVSTQKKLSSENSKWRSQETLLESFRRLAGSNLEEALFDPNIPSSPYCHRFLLVTRNSQVSTYADCGQGYVVYFNTVKCYEPLESDQGEETTSYLRDIQDIRTPNGSLEDASYDGSYGVSSTELFRSIGDNSRSKKVDFLQEDEVDDNDERDVEDASLVYPFINDDDRRCFSYLFFNEITGKWEDRSLSPSEASGILKYGSISFQGEREKQIDDNRPVFSSGEALFYSGEDMMKRPVTYRLVPNCYNVRRIVNSQDYDSSANREILNLRRIAVHPNGPPPPSKNTGRVKVHHEMIKFFEMADSLKKKDDDGKFLGYLGLPTDGTAAKVYPPTIRVRKGDRIITKDRIYGPLSVEKRQLALYDEKLVKSDSPEGILARWSVLALGQFLAIPYHKQAGYCAGFDSSVKLIPQIIKFIESHSSDISSGKGLMQQAPWNSDQHSVQKAKKRIMDIARISIETSKARNKSLHKTIEGFVQAEDGASLDRINSVMNPASRS